MESVIIVDMKDTYYPKDNDIKRLILYIAGKGSNIEDERVIYSNGMGINRKPDKASKHIITMQRFLRKAEKRRCYHLVVSFPEYMKEYHNLVVLAAETVANMIYEVDGFQVFYGIHTKTENIHIHYAINAVSYIDGKKWHKSKKDFFVFRNRILKCINEEMIDNYGPEFVLKKT